MLLGSKRVYIIQYFPITQDWLSINVNKKIIVLAVYHTFNLFCDYTAFSLNYVQVKVISKTMGVINDHTLMRVFFFLNKRFLIITESFDNKQNISNY